MRFQDKVAVVTGAGKGIGLAAAVAFAKEGANLALVDHDPRCAKEALEEVQSANPSAQFFTVDIADPHSVAAMVAEIDRRWGRLDVLVNNAGVYIQGDVLETSLADWERILKVNLTGAYICTQCAVPLMIRNGGGVVVNVASEAGLVGIKGQVAYNVSKGGLISLTRSCAVDLADRGVRVNCVCPGTTDTPLVQEAVNRAPDPALARRHLEEIRPLNRLGFPQEIASAILFMASSEAGYATGSILSMDGGYTAQ